MLRSRLAAAALVLAASVPSAAAAADTPGPAPALAQYVEQLPTSSGPVVAAAEKPQVKKLSPAVAKKVQSQGGPDAGVLEQIATSSTYGAPQTTLPRSGPDERDTATPSTTTEATTTTVLPGGAPTATAKNPRANGTGLNAAALKSQPSYWTDGSGERRLPILAVLMLLATVGLVVASRRATA
jgi:cobalamin biosynthesis Mg chelatase CobN